MFCGRGIFFNGLVPVIPRGFPVIMGCFCREHKVYRQKSWYEFFRCIRKTFEKMEPVAYLLYIHPRLFNGALIRNRTIPWYDLDIGITPEPFRYVLHFTWCDQVNHAVCVNVHHDRTVSLPFPECKIVNAHFCYGLFFREWYVFFLRDCRWCFCRHPQSRPSMSLRPQWNWYSGICLWFSQWGVSFFCHSVSKNQNARQRW